MPFVLDASLALTACFRDEATPEADQVLEQLNDDEAHVPAIWPLELLNALLVARRSGRVRPEGFPELVEVVRSLPVSVEPMATERVFTSVLSFAQAHQLTSYDASYLELAFRLGVPLATKDARLRRAAGRLGLSVLP